VIALTFNGVAAVGNFHVQSGRQRFVLRMQTTMTIVAALDFLQKQEIRPQAMQPESQIRH
jgi:hypothetical protein